jgi:uncharacterized protein involved in type VI secretion and phage assembly
MRSTSLLERVPAGQTAHTQLARVVSVEDPERIGRVQVRLLSYDGIGDQDAPIWARVAVPFAGAERGAFMLPSLGDEVLLSFANGDTRLPVVIGGLWSQSQAPPETLGGNAVDRWTIVGREGTRIAIIEESAGEATISLTTPRGARCEITDSSSGKVTVEAAGSTVTLESSGISIATGAKVEVQASTVEVTAGQVKVNAALSTFSGMVKCDVLQATTVIGTTYTPGAGNIW